MSFTKLFDVHEYMGYLVQLIVDDWCRLKWTFISRFTHWSNAYRNICDHVSIKLWCNILEKYVMQSIWLEIESNFFSRPESIKMHFFFHFAIRFASFFSSTSQNFRNGNVVKSWLCSKRKHDTLREREREREKFRWISG